MRLAIAAALLLLANVALAGTKTLAMRGGWEAFGGTTNTGNQELCGISSDRDGRYFGVKRFGGNKTVTIQLGDNRWRLDNGTKQQLEMVFDARAPWRATANAFHFDDGDAGLEFNIKVEELGNFMREFLQSRKLEIRFPGGSLATWALDVSSAGSVAEEFKRCDGALR